MTETQSPKQYDLEERTLTFAKGVIGLVKICRKEAKESRYWLKLLQVHGCDAENTREILIKEPTELMRIFGAIVEKSK